MTVDHENRAPARGRVKVGTLVLIRWLAVVGQTATLLAVSEGFGVELPMAAAMAVVALSALLNIVVSWRRRLTDWHSDREAALFLSYDIVQLAVLLSLTGGLQNPFAVLFLAPVTIAATILSLTSVIALGGLTLTSITVLAFVHRPLDWPRASGGAMDQLELGIWSALGICTLFLMFYAWRVAAEARRMSDALSATQMSLAHEQELASLGALAASAAHELGTPLSTIGLIAKELANDYPEGSAQAEDLTVLNQQVARCRDILDRLSKTQYADEDPSISVMSPASLALAAAEAHRRDTVRIEVEEGVGCVGARPMLRRSPELFQGMGNLLENAMDFANETVTIASYWDDQTVRLEISDDGPGFAPSIASLLGEPYVSTRRGSGGMGLGVFISKSLLERTGASLRFANRRGGGATVAISWARGIIEVDGTGDAENLG